MTAVLIVWLCIVAAGLFLLYRNNQVGGFRQGLINLASDAAQQDIADGQYDYQWRYAAFESVPYERMLFSLRRLRAENFYDDTSFLTPRQAVKS